ncbi:MAG: acyl-CoA carboxylase subunit beta [Pseudomonadota bacterium]
MPIDPSLIDELAKRRDEALASGGPDRVKKRHDRGMMTARERLEALFTADTFQEFGLYAQHTTRHFGMDKKSLPTDGVLTGVGFVDGRPVASFSQDFMIAGGSLGRIHSQKIGDLMDHAGRAGVPVVGFKDSGGARIQEGVESLAGYGQVFNRNVLLSGVVPQIAVICGNCAGGASYSPALMDFIIMVRNSANMFICGPEVIRAATGQATTMAEIGSAEAHAQNSGNIHFVAENDGHAVAIVRELLSYLPSNNMTDPPHHLSPEVTLADDAGIEDIIPADPKASYDVKAVIGRVVDEGRFFEVQSEFATNIVVGFGRIDGVVVGIIANQPLMKAGTLDIDSSDKGARFIRFCNIFNIPLVTLVDTPGFMPGVFQEKHGIIRHGAKMLFAYGASTVPKLTVIMRKAYGGAYVAMCSKDMGADLVLAWPTAEIAVMGADGAVNILYQQELADAEDKAQKRAELVAEYRAAFANPYVSAGLTFVHDIIEPRRTKAALSLALRSLLSKRENRPAKKHGNIPL